MTAAPRSGRRPTGGRRRVHPVDRVSLLECLLGLAAVAVASGAFAGFFDGLSWLPVVLGAALLGAAVTAVGLLTRRSGGLTALLTSLALVLLVHAVSYGGQSWFGVPTAGSSRALGEGLFRAVPRSLGIGLPADVHGDLLVLPVLLAGAAGAAVVALVLRTARTTPLALPAVSLFVLATALTASSGGPGPVLTGGLLAVLLGLLLVRSNRMSAAGDEGISIADAGAVGVDLVARRRRSLRGRLVLGLPAVVAVAAAAITAGALLPVPGDRERVDPRSYYDPGFTLRSTLSPLVQVRPQVTADPVQDLFTVEVRNDTEPPLDRVRVAGLDTFDGALWTRSGDFRITGSRLPGMPGPPDEAVEVEIAVTVERLPQPFLPVIGEPVRFRGTDFAFDRDTGTAVTTRRSTRGLSYSTSGLVRPRDAALLMAVPSAEPADDPLTELPRPVPEWLEDFAVGLTASGESPMADLLALERHLRERPYNPEAAPGHSYGALYRALVDERQPQIGSAEQYASAFAVLARLRDFPARVAVGYLLRPENLTGDGYRVTTADAHAWVEVHLAGFGWVPFEPTSVDGDVATVPTRSEDVTLESAAERDAGPGAPGLGGAVDAGFQEVARDTARVLGLVLAGVAAGLVAILLAKGVRRGLRARRGPPARRVIGAWREVADRLREAGVHVPRSRTGREVAHGLAGTAAAPVARHVEALASVVAGAVFGFDEPSDADAARAWELESSVRRELAHLLPLTVRLRGRLDPRPLLREPVRRRARRTRPPSPAPSLTGTSSHGA